MWHETPFIRQLSGGGHNISIILLVRYQCAKIIGYTTTKD
jgi:hypothetical protein